MPRDEDIAWKYVERLEGKKWRYYYCRKVYNGQVTRVKSHLGEVKGKGIDICTRVPGNIRDLMMSLLRKEAEEGSRQANHQSSTERLLHDMPMPMPMQAQNVHQDVSLSQTSLELVGPRLPMPGGVADMTNFTHQLSSNQQSQAEYPFHRSSTMPSLAQNKQVASGASQIIFQSDCALNPNDTEKTNQPGCPPERSSCYWQTGIGTASACPQDQVSLHSGHEEQNSRGLSSFPNDQVLGNTSSNGLQGFIGGDSPLYSLNWSDLHHSPPENLVESHDVIVNTPQEIQMNEPHNLTAGSSLHNDSSLDVNSTNRLQDCSQPCLVEVVPVHGNTSPTDTVQHADQLHPRFDKEYGNDSRSFALQTPVDIDPSIASQHASDSHIVEATVDSQVPEAATNATGPSSSQDMNRGSPVMDVRSIYANDEEIRNLKRKVEELDDKEAVIKEQMEIESAASSVRKKPRILVDRWLKETERARNNFQIIGQANAETFPPKEQVETLTREVEDLIGKTLPQTLLIEERDAKGVKFLQRKLIGEEIHGNIEFIWGHLKKNRACNLGIYGMGGVGKTTIMKRVHNRLLEGATFDGVVFVTVSKDFSISKLQIDIGKALKFDVKEVEDEEKRAAILAEHLERKKNCVLILDDVWERLDLEEVGIPVRADGCKLVLTTRSFDVCCQMHCREKIKIEPLSQMEAESLFLEELGSEVPLNSETEAIVKSIVEKCAGLPIGIITMARSMRGVTDVFEWRDSLVKLEEKSNMGQTCMEKVLMNLKFSYDRLGNSNAQQCFLSCALYPKDKLIDKFELIEFFIDQGLIGGLNTRKEQYDRGLTILSKLGNVCLLEDHGHEMKMHDLIRDMALHIMSTTSIVKAGKKLRRIPPEEYWTDVLEKVSLMESEISEFPSNMSPNCPKLSTLLLNGSLSEDVVLPGSFFKQLCGLKVLNLSGCQLPELPNSILELVNLRALLLRKCRQLRRIPYLGKLTSLRKLDASGCFLHEAPEGLEKLVNLRYLDLNKTYIARLPKGILDHLLNLQCLEVSAVKEEDITKLGALEAFGCSLQNIDDFNKCVRFIEQSDSPRYYKLKGSLNGSPFLGEVSVDTQLGILERSVRIWEWGHAIVSVGGEGHAPAFLF
ncbi:probable disease resistance protein At4g27220 [Eucalyptus grandis]|uniref:probable disease resistance protein At4g27220 n=1 Tax=Eucalyptus grandis TaxID=71139 RepID=UPI00192EB25F|nr:probable disease resistance protein At4g27220 [Eucalyptus grandis]